MSDETILEEAQRLVYGARQNAYGHPFDDFSRTGRMWGAILGIPDVPPDKVALCLIGVKISREVNAPKRDNRVDIAGYDMALELVREVEEMGTSVPWKATPEVRVVRDFCGQSQESDGGGWLVCMKAPGHEGPCFE